MILRGPTPEDLDREPQLAALFALEAALEAAAAALIASHDELRDGRTQIKKKTPARIAYLLLGVARDLAALIRMYREGLPGAPQGPLIHEYDPL